MSEGKKISSKKVLRFSIGVVLVIIFMVALAAASMRQNDDYVKGLEITLNDDQDFNFLHKEDIEAALIKNRNIHLSTTKIASLDLKRMEAVAKTNPWIEAAEVFVDNREILKVNIRQREPVARIFDINGKSCYLDSTLHTMPVGVGYAYPVPVFTSVPLLAGDSFQRMLHAKIAFVSEVIGRDSFWKAQITQIDVQPDQTFIMIPLFGNQKILVGDTTMLNEKLSNLFAFYKNISSQIGWDKYETLDVRYKNQVVASPSLGWTPPKIVDTATSDLEGPPIVANATVAAVKAPVVTEKKTVQPKPDLPKKVAEKKVTVKPKATAKPVPQAKKTVKKAESKKEKTNKKEASPKYIYSGKTTGNHK